MFVFLYDSSQVQFFCKIEVPKYRSTAKGTYTRQKDICNPPVLLTPV